MHPDWFCNALAHGEYWDQVEARLETLPMTADDADARDLLVLTAQRTHGGHPCGDPVQFADSIYRLRFVLGPQVPEEVLVENRRTNMRETTALLSRGVSPQLLGLDV